VSYTDGTFYDGETIPIVADGRELVDDVAYSKKWVSDNENFVSQLSETVNGVKEQVSTIEQTAEEISLRVNTTYTTHNLLKRTNRGTENWQAYLSKDDSSGTASIYTRSENIWSISGYSAKIIAYTDTRLYNGGPGMLFVPWGGFYYNTMALLYPMELSALQAAGLTSGDYLTLSFKYFAATMTYTSRIRMYIAKYSYDSEHNCPSFASSSDACITTDPCLPLNANTFTQASAKLQLSKALPELSGSEALYVVLEFQHYNNNGWLVGMQFSGSICNNTGNFLIGNLQLEKGEEMTTYTPADIVSENAAYDTGIDIVNKRVTVTADNFRVQGTNGDTIVTAALVDDEGKLNADLIEAKHFRATNADGDTVLSLNEDNNKAMTVYHDNGCKAMEVTLSTLIIGGEEDICVTKVYDTNGRLVRALCIKNGWINTDTVGNAPEVVNLIKVTSESEVRTTSASATTFYKLINNDGDTTFYTDAGCKSQVVSCYLVEEDIAEMSIGNMSLSDFISANNAANAGFQTNGISSSSTTTTCQRGYYAIDSKGIATRKTMSWQE
jgi:hypothetical protein